MPNDAQESLKEAGTLLFYPFKADRWLLGAAALVGGVGGALFGTPSDIFFGTLGGYVLTNVAFSPTPRAWAQYIGKKVSSFPKQLRWGHVAFGVGAGAATAYLQNNTPIESQYGEGIAQVLTSPDYATVRGEMLQKLVPLTVGLSYVCTTAASYASKVFRYGFRNPQAISRSFKTNFSSGDKRLALLEQGVRENDFDALSSLVGYYFKEGQSDQALGVFFDRMHGMSLVPQSMAISLRYKYPMFYSLRGRSDKEILVQALASRLDKESIDVLIDRALVTAQEENDLSTLALIGFYKEQECSPDYAREYWADVSSRISADQTKTDTSYAFAQSSAVIKELRLSGKKNDPLRSLIAQKEVPLEQHFALHEEAILTSKAREELSNDKLSFPLVMGLGQVDNKAYLRLRRFSWPTAQDYVAMHHRRLLALNEKIEDQSQRLRRFLSTQSYVAIRPQALRKQILSQKVRFAHNPQEYDEGLVQEAINQVQKNIALGFDSYEPSLDNHPQQWLVHPDTQQLLRLDIANKHQRPLLEDVVNETLYPSFFGDDELMATLVSTKLDNYAQRLGVVKEEAYWAFLNNLFLRSNRLAIDVWSLPERKHQNDLVVPLLNYAHKTLTDYSFLFAGEELKLINEYRAFNRHLQDILPDMMT